MIYILEDDASIRKLVVYTIQSQGMEAEGFERPSQFWEALERRMPDLLLLDIMLPEEDGLQVLKRLAPCRPPGPCRSSCSPPRARSTTRCWAWTRGRMTTWQSPLE